MKVFYAARTKEGGRARITQDVGEREEWVAVKRTLAGEGLAVVHWSWAGDEAPERAAGGDAPDLDQGLALQS